MKTKYPENWYEIAYNCKRNFSFICQCCQRNAIDQPGILLNVHHIDRNPENNTDTNLLVLCRNCHIRLHNIEDPQRKRIADYYKAISYGQIPLELPQDLAPQPLYLTLKLLRQLTNYYITK